jgi:hypothetical protein
VYTPETTVYKVPQALTVLQKELASMEHLYGPRGTVLRPARRTVGEKSAKDVRRMSKRTVLYRRTVDLRMSGWMDERAP